MTPDQGRILSNPFFAGVVAFLIFLGGLQVALFWRGGFALLPPASLVWLAPSLFAFSVIAEFSVGFLALARYHLLRSGAEPYWVALGFTARAIALLFYLLAWPGLLPGGGSLIAELPGTSAWIGFLSNSLLSICLLTAVAGRWPLAPALAGWRWLKWFGAWAASVVLVCVVLLKMEASLPALLSGDGQFTVLARGWMLSTVALLAVGVAFSVRRYVTTSDVLPAYIAFAQIAQMFASFEIVLGGNRYSVFAFVGRMLSIGSSLAMLFGLLHDYVRVYQAEVHRAGEIQRLNETLEQRVQERTAELRAANEELDAFAYSVSHDLRSPIWTMRGLAQILLRDYPDRVMDGHATELVKRVCAVGERMDALIEDLLKLSRFSTQALTPQSTDLGEIALNVFEELKGRDPRRPVHIDVQAGLTARADPHLMRAVLENLLGNAWKFTNKTSAASITFGVIGAGSEAVFFVRDNGAGFDMSQADRLFAPFQRLHSQDDFPGTGIGLATVQRIIHRHGGRVWAEGIPGQGATFYFTVQAASSVAA